MSRIIYIVCCLLLGAFIGNRAVSASGSYNTQTFERRILDVMQCDPEKVTVVTLDGFFVYTSDFSELLMESTQDWHGAQNLPSVVNHTCEEGLTLLTIWNLQEGYQNWEVSEEQAEVVGTEFDDEPEEFEFGCSDLFSLEIQFDENVFSSNCEILFNLEGETYSYLFEDLEDQMGIESLESIDLFTGGITSRYFDSFGSHWLFREEGTLEYHYCSFIFEQEELDCYGPYLFEDYFIGISVGYNVFWWTENTVYRMHW